MPKVIDSELQPEVIDVLAGREDDSPEDAIPEEFRLKDEEEPDPKDSAKSKKTNDKTATPDKSEKKEPDPEAKKSAIPTLEELQEQVAQLDKRFKDTQAAYTKETQKRAELETELAALREKKQAETVTEGEGSEEEEASYLSPKERNLLKRIEKIDAGMERLAKVEAQRRWDEKEVPLKAEHEDYDDVVYKVFEPAIAKDSALTEEFKRKGATPAVAYEIGTRIGDAAEMLNDPAAYKERVKKQVLQELQDKGDNGDDGDSDELEDDDKPKPKQNGAKTLARVTSKSTSPKKLPSAEGDVIGEVLAAIRPGG